jgi:SAM-dependent methyltransferase
MPEAAAAATATPDADFLHRHRRIWAARAELRDVYHGFYRLLLAAIGDREPVLELGGGPGFFKQFFPRAVSTDVLVTDAIDVGCDACALPFRDDAIGAIVMIDVLHHVSRPLALMVEAARVLKPGGRMAMIEPWITPASFVLYRYFHHEDCRLDIDVERPFADDAKNAFDGNATIPFKLIRHYEAHPAPLRLVRAEPFLALPYLATLGFKASRPVPAWLIGAARRIEALLGPVGRWNATRSLLVWEKPIHA